MAVGDVYTADQLQGGQDEQIIPVADPTAMARTKAFEGFSPDVYKDTVGKRTIGYGFNIDDKSVSSLLPADVISGKRPLSKEESEQTFEKLYARAQKDAMDVVGPDTFLNLPPPIADVVTDMSYNMGPKRLAGFHKAINALKQGDWSGFGEQIKDSKWFSQVGNRSATHYQTIQDFIQSQKAGQQSKADMPGFPGEGTAMADDQVPEPKVGETVGIEELASPADQKGVTAGSPQVGDVVDVKDLNEQASNGGQPQVGDTVDVSALQSPSDAPDHGLRDLLAQDTAEAIIPKEPTGGEVFATEAAKTAGLPGQLLTGKPALSPGEQEVIDQHPLAKLAGDIIGGAVKPVALAGIPGVGLPVAFGAAGALQSGQEMADRSADPSFQPSMANAAAKEALAGLTGAVTGKIFGDPTLGKVLGMPLPQTVAGRIAERGIGVGATQVAGDLADQAAEGQPPNVKRALTNAAVNTATYALVAGALEVPELRSAIVEEGSRMAGKPVDLGTAKEMIKDAGLNPESISPDFITAAYQARRNDFIKNTLEPMMRKYGATEDTAWGVLQNQNLRLRETSLTKWAADLAKDNPEQAAKILPYFDKIKAGADPVDVMMALDLQAKILAPLQQKVEAVAEEEANVEPTVKAPKSIIAQVRAMGGIDPQKAALSGYPAESFMQNGLFHVLRHGGESPDDIAASLAAAHIISVKDNEKPSDALMAVLKGDQSRLLQLAQKHDDEYEQEFAAWQKENEANGIQVPAGEIKSLEADINKEIDSHPAALYGDWEETPSGPNAAVKSEASPDATANGIEPKYKTEAPAFYSHLERTIQEKMPNAASADQVRGILKSAGVKQEEADWLDIEGFLKDNPKPTKAQLLDYVRANNVQLKEVEKNSSSIDKRRQELEQAAQQAQVRFDQIKQEVGGRPYVAASQEHKKLMWGIKKNDKFQVLPEEYQQELDDLQITFSERDEYVTQMEETGGNAEGGTRFAQYQLPGGTNYRELLLTLPNRPISNMSFDDYLKEYRRVFPSGQPDEYVRKELYEKGVHLPDAPGKMISPSNRENFSSPHFDESNVLAHIRMNDRTDAEGKKVLFIEEVQSDWHQKGRKHGYKGEPSEDQLKSQQFLKAKEDLQNFLIRNDNLGFDTNGEALRAVRVHEDFQKRWEVDKPAEFRDLVHEYKRLFIEADKRYQDLSVPDAPFKKTWPEMAMKRMLRYAAENGYDKLAWTTGEQQAERYDLSKEINSIEWAKEKGTAVFGDFKLIKIEPKNSGMIYLSVDKTGHVGRDPSKKNYSREAEDLLGKNLEDVVGKDIAEKILKDDDGLLAGNGLKVGGQGMKGFYDQILPSFMNKYAKKWGGRVKQAEIIGRDEVKITDLEARKRFRAGQPVFFLIDEGDELQVEEAAELREYSDFYYYSDKKPLSVHAIDITPSMRAAVMEGQPMFKTAPSWQDLQKDKAAYEKANKAGATLIKKYVPQLENSLVNPAYIYTKDGANALGMYFKGQISVKTGAGVNVYIHELGHAVFDMFLTPAEKTELLTAGRKIYGADADVEERIMADFEKYYARQAYGENTSLYAKIRSFFARLKNRLLKFVGSDPDTIKSFYDAILGGKYAKAQPVKSYEGQPQFKEDKAIEPASAPIKGPGIFDPAIATVARSAKEIVTLLNPRALAPREALDVIMQMKGQRDKVEFVLESQLKQLEDAFDRMERKDQVAFIDRIKRGESQPTPALNAVASMMRTVEDQYWAEAKKYKPSLAYKENHYRVMWRVIPGAESGAKGFLGAFRRPLQGTKGFMKQSTLADMSEGLELGGAPYSFNPVTMWKQSIMDMQKFITARRMWEALKDMGMCVFIRTGKRQPPGFVKVDDGISKVYFPVDEGLVDAGTWYVQEGAGLILNNFLSRDYIRASTIGMGLLSFKNLTTGIELALSPFHAAYVSIMASTSSIGLGLQEIANIGIRQRNPEAFIHGLRDIAYGLSGAAAVENTKLGAMATRYIGRDNFLDSKAGQDFIKTFPEAAQLMDDLFTGGGKLAMHQDYKINSLKSFVQGIRDFKDAKNSFEIAAANNDKALMQKYAAEMAKNAFAEVLHLLPATNQMVMKPLFEIYIPRLKVGTFLKEYSMELLARKEQLESGRLTRPQLAREVWDSVERRFGEMNFDNLFWNRNFKTAMQLVFRSVTWKVGALQNIGGAPLGQFQDIKAAVADQKAPFLNRNLAMLLGLAMLVVAFSEIFQKLMIGEWAKDLKDIMDPRYDKQGNRLFLNTHLKDWAHLFHSPGGFLANSTSGYIGRVLEDWKNQDFYHVEIAHPGDPWYQQDWDLLRHLIPIPFIYSNQGKLRLDAAPMPVKMLTAMGVTTPAPGYVTKSHAQQLADQIRANNMPSGARTKADFERGQLKNQFALEYERTGDASILQQGMEQGSLTFAQVKQIMAQKDTPQLLRTVHGFTYSQVASVMDVAEDNERRQLMPVFLQKTTNAMRHAIAVHDKDAYERAADYRTQVLKKYKQ